MLWVDRCPKALGEHSEIYPQDEEIVPTPAEPVILAAETHAPAAQLLQCRRTHDTWLASHTAPEGSDRVFGQVFDKIYGILCHEVLKK
jgi:hypothetical protein